MKRNLTIFAAFLIILNSCGNHNVSENGFKVGFDKGVKVSSSGLSTLNNGLTLTDSYMTYDGMRMANNEVPYGKKISIVFEGVEGFKEKEGKVFPDLSIIVMDESDGVLLRYEDILKSDIGYDAKDASVLSGALTVGDPLKQGQTYKLAVTIADKEGDGAIAASVQLKIK